MYKLVIICNIQDILNFTPKYREYWFCDAIMSHKLNFHSTYFISVIFVLSTVHLPENNLLKLFSISWFFLLKYCIFWIFHWNPGNIVFAKQSWLINLFPFYILFSIIFILRTVHLPENNLLKLFCTGWLLFLIYSIFWIFHWNPGNIVFAMQSCLINLISNPYFFSIISRIRIVHLPENKLLKLFCISRLFFLLYCIYWIFHWNPGNIVFAMQSWLITLISIPHIVFHNI